MLIASGNLTRETLQGKTALVTGAGGGIGYEACRALIWLGARVVIAEINRKNGARTARDMNLEFGRGSALFVHTDVGKESSIRKLQKKALKAYGQVDIVINNATLAPLGAVEELDIGIWDTSYNVNLRGPVLLARAFVPEMRERNQGVFMCVSSMGTAYMGPYESMKAAQVHLANTLEAELEGTGVVAFTIGPGYVPTETASSSLPKLAAMMGLDLQELNEILKEQTISVEAAGAGFAAAAALAENFRGQETASMAALIAAGIDVQTGTGEKMEYSPEQYSLIGELAGNVKQTLDEQHQGYKERSVFEQQWLYRNFRKFAGVSVNEALDNLGQIESAASQQNGEMFYRSRLLPKGMAGFYNYLHEMAKGYIKDPQQRKEHLAIVRGWQSDTEQLAELLNGQS